MRYSSQQLPSYKELCRWLGKVYIIQLTIHILLDDVPPSVVKEKVRPENEPECAELFESYLKAAKKEETKTVHSKIRNM